MSRTRIINGSYTKITQKDYNLFSEGNTHINALGKNQFTAENETIYDSKVKIAASYQPKNSVDIYVGMFFDGTGNNRYNSETIYYNELSKQGGKIKSETVPSQASYTKTIKEKKGDKQVQVKYTDRDSYWNPYSNIVKLFDLYKEKSQPSKDDITILGGYPELGEYALFKQYVEGIGTKQDESDDIMGSGLGRGEWGIISRVEEGIDKLVTEQLRSFPKNKKINRVVFDVFGFSRGAAAARHFCNEVKKKAKYQHKRIRDPYDSKGIILSPEKEVIVHAGGRLGKKLSQAGLKPYGDSYKIEIRFLGLFDTVISDMIVKENMGYKIGWGGIILPILKLAPLAQDALQDIKTNISGLGIRKVFHIKAQSEWRKNFAFTPTEEGYTLGILGAHSDIGGGYAEMDLYEPILAFFDVEKGNNKMLSDMEKYKQFYINQLICRDDHIKFINTYDHVSEAIIAPASGGIYTRDIKGPENFPDEGKTISKDIYYQVYQTKISDHYILKDSRYISNKYSLIPMYLMLDKAIEYNVPFYSDYNSAQDVEKKFEYELPDDKIFIEYLEEMKKISKDENKDKDGTYMISNQMYSHICNNYVHLSAHFGGLKNDFLTVHSGDHHFLEKYVFINQPEDPIIENGNVHYSRGIFTNT